MNDTKENLTIITFDLNAAEIALKSFRDKMELLKAEYVDVPDCTEKDGYKLARERLGKMVGFRGAVDKERKSLKSDALAYNKKVESLSQGVISETKGMEEPYRLAIKKIDDEKDRIKEEKARKERERRDELLAEIDAIKNVVQSVIGLGSDEIGSEIEKLKGLELVDEHFQEFYEGAVSAAGDTIEKLEQIKYDAIKREEAAAEQARIAKENAENEARLKKEREEFEAKQKEERVQREARDAEEKRQREAREADEKAKRDAEDAERRRLQGAEDARRRKDQEEIDRKNAEAERRRLEQEEAEEEARFEREAKERAMREQEKEDRRRRQEAEDKKRAEEQAEIDRQKAEIAQEKADREERERAAKEEKEAEEKADREAKEKEEARLKNVADRDMKVAVSAGKMVDAIHAIDPDISESKLHTLAQGLVSDISDGKIPNIVYTW